MAYVSPNTRRNRLSSEKSPYLLQHAANPVDWFPWCDEAKLKAKAENKPIFLSVGYSTCHWCHVMERESFSQEGVAAILNEHFISIKVDREERPDIDRVYMTFLQATSNESGWPMSVWLTPDLHPFVAGTYFPAKDGAGKSAFSTVLQEVARQWTENRQMIISQGKGIYESLLKSSVEQMDLAVSMPDPSFVMKCFEQLKEGFDVENGGFGKPPKFSQAATFNFLLRMYATNPYSDEGQQALTMTLMTLRKMAGGGIHDHIGNGFHRYSTDKFWHVPHFEKMLYDQAQLCVSYIEAYQISKDLFFADIARDILTYIARDLSDIEGGFYSAEDAESLPQLGDAKQKEGAFCCWRHEEIKQLLPQVVEGTCMAGRCISFWEVFCHHYCIQPEGNVPGEPGTHGDLKGQNVLKVGGTVEETSQHFNIAVNLVDAVLDHGKRVLLESRRLRPRPHRDDKIVTAWNGLAISAFARAAQVLCDEDCVQRAIMGARFLEVHMYNPTTGLLKRNAYRHSDGLRQLGISSNDAFAPDYAFLIRGLIDLYETTFDDHWMEWAIKLQDTSDRLFWDEGRGGYFDNAVGDPSILLRLKEDHDGTEPSASSVACSNLHRLADYTQNQMYRDRANVTFNAFGMRLSSLPMLLPEMVCAYLYSGQQSYRLHLTGTSLSTEWKELLNAIHGNFVPFKTISYVPTPTSFVARHMPALQSIAEGLGLPQVYISHQGVTHPPTADPITIANLLTPSPPQAVMPNNYTFELSAAVSM